MNRWIRRIATGVMLIGAWALMLWSVPTLITGPVPWWALPVGFAMMVAAIFALPWVLRRAALEYVSEDEARAKGSC